MEEKGDKRYSFYSFTTSALDVAIGQPHAPPWFSRGKDPRYSLDRRLGGSQNSSGHRGFEKKSSYLCRGSKLDWPVVQYVARHYTDWATPALMNRSWSSLKYFPSIALEGLKKTTETLSHVSRSVVQEFNPRLSVWKVGLQCLPLDGNV
jgi:hypothetical protein